MALRERSVRAAAALALAGVAWAGPAIERVEVAGAARDGDYLAMLAREVAGPTYDAASRGRVVQALLATGIAGEVELSYRDGLLSVVVLETPILGRLDVSCVPPCALEEDEPWRTELVRGRRVTGEDLDRAVRRLSRQLARRGYPDARVDLSVLEAPRRGAPRRVDVHVAIHPGPPERIARIEVPPGDRAGIAAHLAEAGVAPGGALDRPAIRRALEAAREELEEAGEIGPRLDASVRRGEDGAVVLVEVTHGPRLTLLVDGKEPRRRRRRELLEDAPPDARQAAELVADVLEEELEAEGRWGSRVRATATEQGLEVVTEERPRVRIVSVTADLPGELAPLLAELETRPSGYRLASGYVRERLSRRRLARDRDRLARSLVASGYAEARVDEPAIAIADGKARVHFRVLLGRRLVIAGRTVEGWPADIALPPLRSVEGGGFAGALVEDDRQLLERTLADEGFLEARVEAEVQVRSSLERGVRLVVEPGRRSRVRGVAVRGSGWLSPEDVADLTGLEEGAAMRRELLDDVERDVGVVPLLSEVTALAVTGTPGEDGGRAAVVDVREGPRYRFRYAFGYNSEEGPRGTLGITDLALLRGPRALSLLLRGGSRERRVEASLQDPFGFFTDRPLSVTGFAGQEEREGFSLEKRGGLVDIGLLGRQARDTALQLRFLRKEIELFDVTISEAEIPRSERDISLFEIGLEGVLDRSDDPLSPSRGFRARLVTDFAVPSLGAEANFLKASLEVSGYLPIAKGMVLAGTLRGGAGEPLGSAGEIPISERFFLGGVSHMRAFGRDEVGPRDAASGEPVGGAGFHQESVELRVPLWGSLGAALFYERGDVVEERRELELGRAQSDWGIGLRYRTPAGPVRLEYAREIGARDPEDRVVLSLGEAF